MPPLGFIHEDSVQCVRWDMADMWRVEVTSVPLAFSVTEKVRTQVDLAEKCSWRPTRSFVKQTDLCDDFSD